MGTLNAFRANIQFAGRRKEGRSIMRTSSQYREEIFLPTSVEVCDSAI